MSSLPHAWHSIPVPIRKGMPSSATSMAPTVQREEWNSHLCYETLPSKLPVYKPSSAKLRSSPVRGMLSPRHIPKAFHPGPKNVAVTGLRKPLTTKQYLDEIAKLQKELIKLETEKSFMEAEFRRVNEENVRNSKEIEKLKSELKAAQKEMTTQ